MTTKRPSTLWAWDGLWVGLLALYVIVGYSLVPFHGDESMLIFMSRDYAYHFIEGDLTKIIYTPDQPREIEQDLRLLNGTITKYAIGWAWHQNDYALPDLNQPWYWGLDFQYNVENGFYPSLELLHLARLQSTLMLAGSVVIFFIIGRIGFTRPVAYIATAFYTFNPAVLVNGRRGMMEGAMLLGGLSVVALGVWMANRQPRRWNVWESLLLGGVAGFALACKHTNLVFVGAVFIGLGLQAIWQLIRKEAVGRYKFATVCLAVGWMLLSFYALNPAWWHHPLPTAQHVLHLRSSLLAEQSAFYGAYQHPLESLRGFYQQVFVPQTAMYFEDETFRRPLQADITAYEQSVYSGLRLPSVGLAMLGATLIGVLGMFGVVSLPDINPTTRFIFIPLVIALVLMGLFAIPLAWQRYYLPIMPISAYLATLGLAWVVRLYATNAQQDSPQFQFGRGGQR
ncbi:MAG: phospholipid carrier-dependent glycosyltransferase [Phototrophicaceae bacterium]